LAMLSLEPDTLHVAKAFGVISLFNLIWDDKLSEKIKKLYGFDYNNLIEITGKYDIFSLETAATLRSTLAEHESQSTILDPAVNERDNRIAILNQAHFEANTRLTAIENSTLWKMTAPLRRVLTRTPTLRKLFRRSIKLVWWTSTFQLGTRLREWKARDIKVIDVPHFAPPTDDWSLAVPLGYNTDAWKSALPEVAVICHMFYPEMADEFQGYLTNIPFPFDLLITTDSQEKRAIIEIHFSQWKRGKIEVRIAPNRGRDIAPKLITCRDAYDKYEFILHIHTKKSPHHAHWGGWRHHLLETLLGSEKIVESVFESFKSDSKLGMISPQHYTPVRNWIGWGWNFENAKTFARALNINISLNGQIDFPSGSMFWARSAALKPLLDYNLSLDEFPIEDNQNDGTLGHVIERLYFFICERAGYRWIKVSRSIPPEQMERTKYVENQKQLTDFIIGAQSKLLQPGILPRNRSFLRKSREDASGEHRKLSQLVYEKSDYKYMDFSQFQHELALHIQKKQSLIDFDEKFYLGANPDAAVSVATGIFSCGFIHYCMVGRDEGRVWSDYQLKRIFSLSSNFPNGFSAPIHFRPLKRHSIDLSSLPRNPARFLLILISHLQDDLFFAGYTAFFSDFCPIFGKFSKVIFSIESERYNPRLATQYSDRIEVVQERKLRELKFRPDLIVAFNSQLFIKAKQIFNDPTRTIYYCQDFESGFFPYSAEYVEAAKAIVDTQNIIVSTDLLRKFLVNRQLLSHQRIYTTSPKIEPFDVPPEKTKRLFFYFRPESFHRRNLPETLIEAVQDFCNKHTGYEIYMVGSVDTRFSYKINNTPVYVISKLPKKEYLHLISSSDVVISMIYSAHPGLIAFQAAASGIPTVTNVFENRNKFLLKNISENILPYDPIRDNLLERIEEALSMPKGRKSFNEELYSGSKSQTLNDFIDTVLSSECVGLSSQKQL
ncbi:MAG: rhamnan synthesis F family protein, partial [Nitrosospira sp.]